MIGICDISCKYVDITFFNLHNIIEKSIIEAYKSVIEAYTILLQFQTKKTLNQIQYTCTENNNEINKIEEKKQ